MKPIVIVMGVTGVGKTTIGSAASPMRSTSRSSTPTTSTATPRRRRCTRASRSPTPNARRGSTGSTTRCTSTRQPARCSACSALTDDYRARLTAGLDQVRFLLLTGDPELIRRRIAARLGHFAGPDLLPSQLDTLEIPADAVTVNVDAEPDVVVQRALDVLGLSVPPKKRADRGDVLVVGLAAHVVAGRFEAHRLERGTQLRRTRRDRRRDDPAALLVAAAHEQYRNPERRAQRFASLRGRHRSR